MQGESIDTAYEPDCKYELPLMIKTFEHAVEEGHKDLLVYGSFSEPVFMAEHVGEMVGTELTAMNKLLRSWMDVRYAFKVKVVNKEATGKQRKTHERWALTEGGLTRFAFSSRNERAVVFRDWICFDVIPCVRKAGHFNLEKLSDLFKLYTEEEYAKQNLVDDEISSSKSMRITFVYFMRILNTEFVKIGFSIDPQNRKSQLQTGNPHKLGVDFAHPTTRPRDLEDRIHKDLSIKQVRGEWYLLPINVHYPSIVHDAENKLL